MVERPRLRVPQGLDRALHDDADGAPFGIPYILVDKNQPKIPVNFTLYDDESDPGPYPIPLNAPIEGGNPNAGDRHVLAVDKDAKMLYELYVAQPQSASWNAGCGAIFDLASNELRHDGCCPRSNELPHTCAGGARGSFRAWLRLRRLTRRSTSTAATT